MFDIGYSITTKGFLLSSAKALEASETPLVV